MDTSLNNNNGNSPSSRRPLWIAIAALGTVAVALGATLAYTQLRAPAAEPAALAAVGTVPAGPGTPGAPVLEQKQPPALVKADENAPKNVVKTVPKAPPVYRTPERETAYGGASNYPVNQPTPRPVCANCGAVESVTPVQRAGQGSGVGVVAGGVLGAIVGNQVGGGSGRTAATVLGALGGGYAGNQVEKNIKKETVYQVRVRMEDGSVRTLEQATAPALGARVTVDGTTLRGAEGAGPAAPSGRTQPNYVYTGNAY